MRQARELRRAKRRQMRKAVFAPNYATAPSYTCFSFSLPLLGNTLVVVFPHKTDEADKDERTNNYDVKSPGDRRFDVASTCSNTRR